MLESKTLPEVQRLLEHMQLALLILIVLAVLAPLIAARIKLRSKSPPRAPLTLVECRELLGCSVGSSAAEIERRYRELKAALTSAKLDTADISDELRVLSRERLALIEEAYEKLSTKD